ncbi:hypothetical protein LTR10_022618 [Elasticomyces elasticus]|uniref:Extracellular membrane protein CFEM domain-containing protein n=1 Tax=Exophiala sideris TaxID=1016849 RepID=A0ABR0JAN0_9EURO|nr:hypothetical protein LTR10_022618 [Elasticomyces elasticus]KAK5026147.1 hypothetical protein LTS07_007672 [Exophiala sideris]KAK5032401.1 hypothetical protein LTR13_007224 [Exophiala sideris]KAK5059557.1 hypothetical protein LTR69_006146 [Exophiala sideris]KAK5178160.1 hypothetical protein LTR44_009466 [Eurotiomycetes sp. CCFEE 6388]
MARFQLFISLYLAFYLRVATAANYNQWSDLPDCAHYCFSFAVNNMMAPCNYDLECVCVSRRMDFVGIATVCLSGEAGTPCANDTVAQELINYGNNVLCNASNKDGIVFDVVSGGTTYKAALDSQATGQAEWTTTYTANATRTQSQSTLSSAATTATQNSSTTSSVGSNSTAHSVTTSPFMSSTTAAIAPGPETSYSTFVVTMNTSNLPFASTDAGPTTTVTASASATTSANGRASQSDSARSKVGRAWDTSSFAGLLALYVAAAYIL